MNEIKQTTADIAKKEVDLARFNEMCDRAQKWAKEVGLTEEILYDEIKKMRKEKREKRQSA